MERKRAIMERKRAIMERKGTSAEFFYIHPLTACPKSNLMKGVNVQYALSENPDIQQTLQELAVLNARPKCVKCGAFFNIGSTPPSDTLNLPLQLPK